jgi:hypothetical protein
MPPLPLITLGTSATSTSPMSLSLVLPSVLNDRASRLVTSIQDRDFTTRFFACLIFTDRFSFLLRSFSLLLCAFSALSTLE